MDTAGMIDFWYSGDPIDMVKDINYTWACACTFMQENNKENNKENSKENNKTNNKEKCAAKNYPTDFSCRIGKE